MTKAASGDFAETPAKDAQKREVAIATVNAEINGVTLLAVIVEFTSTATARVFLCCIGHKTMPQDNWFLDIYVIIYF